MSISYIQHLLEIDAYFSYKKHMASKDLIHDVSNKMLHKYFD